MITSQKPPKLTGLSAFRYKADIPVSKLQPQSEAAAAPTKTTSQPAVQLTKEEIIVLDRYIKSIKRWI